MKYAPLLAVTICMTLSRLTCFTSPALLGRIMGRPTSGNVVLTIKKMRSRKATSDIDDSPTMSADILVLFLNFAIPMPSLRCGNLVRSRSAYSQSSLLIHLGEYVNQLRRAVFHLDHESIDPLNEQVVRNLRRDGDHKTRHRGDQRF